MPVRRSTVVTLALAGALGGGAIAVAAPAALAGGAQVPSNLQTHPSVRPRIGRRHSTFELTFTLAEAPGRVGFLDTSYRALVSPPAHAASACTPTQPSPVFSGAQDSTSKIPLRPPARAWCKGRYEVTVFLERTSDCGPPLAAAPRIPCPVSPNARAAFHDVQVDTGQTRFAVR